MDYIGYDSFRTDKIRKTANNKDFSVFLPLYFGKGDREEQV